MHAQVVLAAALGSLAFASARHHTSSYSYSNLETLYTTQTDWQGQVTGQPTSHPPVVTSFPSKILASMQSLQSAHDASLLGQTTSAIDPATLTHLSPGLQTAGAGAGHSAHQMPHTPATTLVSVKESNTGAAHHATNHPAVQNAPSDDSSSDSGSNSENGKGNGDNAAQVQVASVGTMLAAAVAAVLFA